MIFSYIIWFLMAVIPFALVAVDIVLIVKKREKAWFEILAFLAGFLYMFGAFIIWDLPDYDYPLNVYGTANAHAPFNFIYMDSLVVFALWGFISYLLLKYIKKKLPPIVEALILAGVYIGNVLSGIWIIQL